MEQENHRHNETVAFAKKQMPDENTLNKLSGLYKVFGDTTRIKILYSLSESEMCVCCISELHGMSLSAVSHQLRVLKQAELVKFRRDGKEVYYSLADDHVKTIIGQGLDHINE